MRATRLSKLWLKALRTDSNTIGSVPLNFTKLTGQTANFVEVRDTDDSTVLYSVDKNGQPSTPLSAPTTAPLGIMQMAEVSVTNAQIKALRATPKTLVAAPGAGRMLQFVSAQLINNGGTNALTESADNAAIKYTDGSGFAVSQTIECTGFIDQTAATTTNALPAIDTIVASATVANAALVLHNTGDGEWGGNAAADVTLKVRVFYRVLSTT